jgi:hypothetical protein
MKKGVENIDQKLAGRQCHYEYGLLFSYLSRIAGTEKPGWTART